MSCARARSPPRARQASPRPVQPLIPAYPELVEGCFGTPGHALRQARGERVGSCPLSAGTAALLRITALADVATAEIDTLLDAAFGADRHTRTAYRLREGCAAIPALSFAGFDGGAFVASLQCWPLALHDGAGAETPLVLVGPIAVAPARQGEGFGRLITLAAVAAADRLGAPPLVLIGDPEFYARFGFSAQATGGWRLPGPWEPHRLLARDSRRAALPAEGLLGPPREALACKGTMA